jgi:Ca2+-binding RTX toxin-like protein
MELRRTTMKIILGLMLVFGVVTGMPAAGAVDDCTIMGTEGDDVFLLTDQTTEQDDICGLGGDDVFFWSPDSDFYYGGAGRDTVNYSGFTRGSCASCRGVTADLEADVVHEYPGVDRIVGVEDVVASNYPDTIVGQPQQVNRIVAGAARDSVYFNGTGDEIRGEGGADSFFWINNDGVASPAVLKAGPGKDWLRPGIAQDGVTVDLSQGTIEGPEVSASFTSILNVIGVGGASDVLIGDAAANRLFGESGDDLLYGGEGDDALRGGEGEDEAHGQAGIDYCVAETETFCERP